MLETEWKAKESALSAEKQRIQYEIANSTASCARPVIINQKSEVNFGRLKDEIIKSSITFPVHPDSDGLFSPKLAEVKA